MPNPIAAGDCVFLRFQYLSCVAWSYVMSNKCRRKHTNHFPLSQVNEWATILSLFLFSFVTSHVPVWGTRPRDAVPWTTCHGQTCYGPNKWPLAVRHDNPWRVHQYPRLALFLGWPIYNLYRSPIKYWQNISPVKKSAFLFVSVI